jgi:flavin-binding protein dodecin
LTPCGYSEDVEFDPCGPPQLPAMPVTEMKDHVYKILELVGSSEKSIEDAIQNAITRASKTIREMKWFEVVQTRGHIEKDSVRHYQVTLRVGFTLEE